MSEGKADVIVGLDYGDEGKGRIADNELDSGKHGVVATFNGGPNAGRTLVSPKGKTLVLNSVPAGVFHAGVMNYIGSGCVVDPVHLVRTELPRIEEMVKMDGRLMISDRATAITPIHILADQLMGGMIGTTGKGIGPAYVGKAMRADGELVENLRLAEIIDNPGWAAEVMGLQYLKLAEKYKRSGVELGLLKVPAKINEFIKCVLELEKRGFIQKDILWMTRQVQNGVNVLMEGSQAYGLDVGMGAVPYTTSSSTLAANAYVGADLSPRYHGKTIGVSKLIPSRVGAGSFVGEFGGKRSEEYCAKKDADGKPKYRKEVEAELLDPGFLLDCDDELLVGTGLRIKTGEYGAATGRPRRIGKIDLPRISMAARHSGIDELYLTRFDNLSLFKDVRIFEGKMPIITGYKKNGRLLDYVPATARELREIEPVVELIEIPGIENAEAFVKIFQEATRARVAGVGVGPGRDQMHYF